HLEVLLAKGYNDSEENLARLETFIAELSPDRVDVTTLSRPGTLDTASAVDDVTLARWRQALGSTTGVDRTGAAARDLPAKKVRAMLEASLARRPQTVLQLVTALGVSENSIHRALEELADTGRLTSITKNGDIFHALLGD
ncbi:MAG: radical SAM protein, partial [Proteobacteria bacterium]|nr:radical SAM protein [Pseudomonadota bacterium]MBU1612359.1 radical SAM protein [Pseudomonadota bacterium]